MKENDRILDKDSFLQRYRLTEWFPLSELLWEDLESIYYDYCSSIKSIKDCCDKFENYCRKQFFSDHITFHSISCRCKEPEHLIEKIIRKRSKEQITKYKGINVKNYKYIIQDLIGLRILVIKKEDWEIIFDELVKMFPFEPNSELHMDQKPVAYIRYGDRNIYKDKITKEYSNKGYRSQHYIVKFNGYFCEIQVRTLAEEVYGEFDHLVKYPYRNDNSFLIRYTNILSGLVNSIDEIMSTCFQMDVSGWETNQKYFNKDAYDIWTNTSQNIISESSNNKSKMISEVDTKSPINIKEHASCILLRKEKKYNGE